MRSLLAVLLFAAIPAFAEIPWGQTITQGDMEFTPSKSVRLTRTGPLTTIYAAGHTHDENADQYRLTIKYRLTPDGEVFTKVDYATAAIYKQFSTDGNGAFSHAQVRFIVYLNGQPEVTEMTIDKGRFQLLGTMTLR